MYWYHLGPGPMLGHLRFAMNVFLQQAQGTGTYIQK